MDWIGCHFPHLIFLPKNRTGYHIIYLRSFGTSHSHHAKLKLLGKRKRKRVSNPRFSKQTQIWEAQSETFSQPFSLFLSSSTTPVYSSLVYAQWEGSLYFRFSWQWEIFSNFMNIFVWICAAHNFWLYGLDWTYPFQYCVSSCFINVNKISKIK